MSRYIDYDAIDYRNDKMHDKSSDFIDGVVYMAERIEEAPSIDLADYVPKDFHDKTCEAMAKRHTEEIQKLMPKQGEWKHLKGDEWLCSNCGYVVWTEGSWEHPLERGKDYCEHCGARMKGADDE